MYGSNSIMVIALKTDRARTQLTKLNADISAV